MYTFDAAEAKKADQKGGFITDTGKYKGKFTRVEALEAATGTKGVGFSFLSDDGMTTNFNVYTVKADGKVLMGNQFIMALMACLKLRGTGNPVDQEVERYDYETKQKYLEDAPVFPALMNQPIGLLLQKCQYEKEKDRVKTGETGWKIEPYGVFQAESEMVASEVMSKASRPEMLTKMVEKLKDRPLRGGSAMPAQASKSVAPSSPGMPADWDEAGF